MSTIERTITVSFRHRIHFTRNVFGLGNPVLKEALAGENQPVGRQVIEAIPAQARFFRSGKGIGG